MSEIGELEHENERLAAELERLRDNAERVESSLRADLDHALNREGRAVLRAEAAEDEAARLERLVRSAVRNAHRLRPETRVRWSWVAETLAVGATTAGELCRWAGADPDEDVGLDTKADSTEEDDHG